MYIEQENSTNLDFTYSHAYIKKMFYCVYIDIQMIFLTVCIIDGAVYRIYNWPVSTYT